ncbi:MAG: CC0125/CC1285 family lipoprotein [Candidatus Binatia bacterium]
MRNRVSAERILSRLVRSGLIAVLIPLVGCATAYELENPTGGYSDFLVEKSTYRVRFKGNNYTPRDRVEDFLLYRCAELTDQLGYDHFLLVGSDTLDISDTFARAGVFPRNYYATALIKVYNRPDNPAAHNAKEVMRKLEARYPDELDW